MNTPNTKKRLVVSYNNLPVDVQEQVKALYPAGFSDVMIRVEKPSGDFFYAVPFDTEEVAYLVKIDVKIDDATDDGLEDDFYGDDEIKGADEIQDNSMEDDDDM